MIEGNEKTVEKILEFLQKDIPFTFLRYGDGDFISMYPHMKNKTVGRNNRSYITPEIQTKLIESYSIDKDNYLIGTLEDIRHKRSMISNVDFSIIKKLPITHPSKLYSAIALQELFLENPEKFLTFCRLLNSKKTVYVNHYYEPMLDKFIGKVVGYVNVPKFNSCGVYEKVLDDIKKIGDSNFDQIILSAGQLSRVIGKTLYEEYPNKTILDIGSVSDKLIIDTKTFKSISKRGHIVSNMKLIRNNLKYLQSNL